MKNVQINIQIYNEFVKTNCSLDYVVKFSL